MPRTPEPVTKTDAAIAAGIMAVTVMLVAGIVVYAEHIKRDGSGYIVESIATANKKRILSGKPTVTGVVDDTSPLVVSGELEAQDWANLPYVFYGAEAARQPCIVASAARKMDGRWGASKSYAKWGICATAKGGYQAFERGCTIDCRDPEPEKPAATPPPPPATAAPPPPPRIKAPINVSAPDLGGDKPEQKSGCSVTGCFGTSCCDAETDRCVGCPGNSCCEKGLGCKGTCQDDQDCAQGCQCVKLPGSPWGNCRGK